MTRHALALAALTGLTVLSACAPEVTREAATDAESVARSLLTARLLEPPAQLQAVFSADRRPEEFPLRMMAGGAEDLSTARLDRLRMIDGRAVATARVTLDGVAQLFEFWLEKQEGAWRVAGWSPTPTALPTADGPVPEVPPDPPAALLGPFFRAAHPVLAMPLVTAVEGLVAGPGASARAKVSVKMPTVLGACKPAEVAAAVEHTAAALSACYGAALAGAPPRMGRITYQLQYTSAQPAPRVSLVESTLLLTGLSECLAPALEGARLEGRSCTASVPIVFTPVPAKKPATP